MFTEFYSAQHFEYNAIILGRGGANFVDTLFTVLLILSGSYDSDNVRVIVILFFCMMAS